MVKKGSELGYVYRGRRDVQTSGDSWWNESREKFTFEMGFHKYLYGFFIAVF